MSIDGRDTYAIAPATGFVSENAIVKDGKGNEHKVPFAIIDSMVIEGTCDQVDISALLNKLQRDRGLVDMKTFNVVFTVIPMNRKPVVQLIEFP